MSDENPKAPIEPKHRARSREYIVSTPHTWMSDPLGALQDAYAQGFAQGEHEERARHICNEGSKMRNDHEDAARQALSHDPTTMSLWDRVCREMESKGLDSKVPYHAFMTGRYVGEMLERGEFRGLQMARLLGLKLPVRNALPEGWCWRQGPTIRAEHPCPGGCDAYCEWDGETLTSHHAPEQVVRAVMRVK